MSNRRAEDTRVRVSTSIRLTSVAQSRFSISRGGRISSFGQTSRRLAFKLDVRRASCSEKRCATLQYHASIRLITFLSSQAYTFKYFAQRTFRDILSATYVAQNILRNLRSAIHVAQSTFRKARCANYVPQSTFRKVLCATCFAQRAFRKVLCASYLPQSTLNKILSAKYLPQRTLCKLRCASYVPQSTLRKALPAK